jgi:4-hydroxybenzoate polyprenyltransferase
MKNYLKLIRIEQWVKNLFVFAPLFFSGKITNPHLFFESIFAFLVFSFTASSIYIINDYFDIESDKKHPEKKHRPLASGVISKSNARLLFAFLVLLAVSSVFVGSYLFHENLWKLSLFISSSIFCTLLS